MKALLDSAVMEMQPDLAKRKAEAIEMIPDHLRTQMDEALLLGYRALAKGKPLIDVGQAMRQAGADEAGRPRLAIAAADQATVRFRSEGDGTGGYFWTSRRDPLWSRRATRGVHRFPVGTWPKLTNRNLQAVVPLIPAEHRPARSHPRNFHILWEAAWQDVPGDPFLLRHVHGMLYVVLAEWDLTALEQSILRALVPNPQP